MVKGKMRLKKITESDKLGLIMLRGSERNTSSYELVNEFPCLGKLKGTVENSPWHDYDDVLKHTEAVVKETKKALQEDGLQDYFSQSVGENGITRGGVLIMAAAFHDIAKPETIKINNGVTSCLGHELLGAKQTEIILKDRFEGSVVDRVVSIIKIHDLPHRIISPGKTEDQMEQELGEFKKENGEIFPDLVVLGVADTRASQLNKKNPDEFNFRMNWYEKILDELF